MPVRCVKCGKRLLDVCRKGDAEVAIKCPACRHVGAYALDTPDGRTLTDEEPSSRADACGIIDTEQRALK